jgi:polysaccharide export outer membrane protein
MLRKICVAAVLVLSSLAVNSEPYQQQHRLGPGDQVAISVYGEPELSKEITIDKTGAIDFPFIGEVLALGATTEELRKEIDSGLRGDYLVAPEVTVSITHYRPYYVNGEVRKPSAYPYVPGTTIIKAITNAGGYTPRAAKDRIIIQREGKEEVYRARPDTVVRPGDIITVKESLF